MPNVDVAVIVKLKDSASAGLAKLGNNFRSLDSKLTTSVGNFSAVGATMAKVSKVAVGLGIALAGVITGVGAMVYKFGMAASRIQELELAMYAVGRATKVEKSAIDDTVSKLRSFNIAHDKALQITAKFMQSELELTDAIKLSNVAKDLAVISGQDSSEALNTLTDAIVSQFPIQLRQFGIVKSLNQIYEEYADTMHLNANNLTELQKKQAFLNVILKEGEKVAGVYDEAMNSVSKRMRSLTGRIIPDLKADIGQMFEPALAVLFEPIYYNLDKLGKWFKDPANTQVIEQWKAKLEGYAWAIRDAISTLIKKLGEFKDFITNEVIPKLSELRDWFKEHEVAIDALKGFITGVLVVALVGLASTIWTVTIPALVGLLIAFAPFVIVGGIFAATYAFMNWLSKKTTGFTLLEQLGAAIDILKEKFMKFVEWVDNALDKIDRFLHKRDEAGGGGGGGSWKQAGGLVTAGKPYIVGEAGPEMFVPPTSGRIAPNRELSSIRGGGGLTINTYIGLYAGSEIEKRNVAKELYKSLMLLAQGQGKTVDQLLVHEVG